MSEAEEQINEELQLLARRLRQPQFKFVVVQYNQYKLIGETANFLAAQYPDRKLQKWRVKDWSYRKLMDAIYGFGEGLILIEDFNEILAKKELYLGLNQRRDKIAQYPIGLIVFLPSGGDVLANLARKMPDLWSFRNMLLDLNAEIDWAVPQPQGDKLPHTVNPQLIAEMEPEIQRIMKRLDELEDIPENQELRIELLLTLGEQQNTIGNYLEASNYLEHAWTIKGNQPSYRLINALAASYKGLTDYDKAIQIYKLGLELLTTNNVDVFWISNIYLSLGDLCQEIGEIEKALGYFEEYMQSLSELLSINPKSEQIMYGLAISYERLGDINLALGQTEKALGYFEESMRIREELFEANPKNEEIKNGLAIANERLGNLYQSLGQTEKALGFFEEYMRLNKELFEANPKNEHIKKGLAIANERLGDLYQSLGQTEKALGYFEESMRLVEELFKASPKNGHIKNGLAIANSKLGYLYKSAGQPEKALGYFEKYMRLNEELFDANPKNEELFSGLIKSYVRLGLIKLELGNQGVCIEYLEKALKMSEEGVERFPTLPFYKQSVELLRGEIEDINAARP